MPAFDVELMAVFLSAFSIWKSLRVLQKARVKTVARAISLSSSAPSKKLLWSFLSVAN